MVEEVRKVQKMFEVNSGKCMWQNPCLVSLYEKGLMCCGNLQGDVSTARWLSNPRENYDAQWLAPEVRQNLAKNRVPTPNSEDNWLMG